jgi:hypothetical protein
VEFIHDNLVAVAQRAQRRRRVSQRLCWALKIIREIIVSLGEGKCAGVAGGKGIEKSKIRKG